MPNYWTTFTLDQWSEFSLEDWSTFLLWLEPIEEVVTYQETFEEFGEKPFPNHARLMFINKLKRDQYMVGLNRFVPQKFVPVAQPAELERLNQILFGTDPDQLTINYRADQLMRLIHADPVLEPYVYQLDPRVTYLDNYWYDFSFTHTLEQSTDYGDVSVISPLKAFSKIGHHVYSAGVSIYSSTGGDHLIKIYQYAPEINLYGYLVEGTGYVEIPLLKLNNTESGLKLRILLPNRSSRLTPTIQTRAETLSWIDSEPGATQENHIILDASARPEISITDYANEISNRTLTNWNWTQRGVEPFKTLHEAARYGETSLRRLGATVLLMAYRTNEIYDAVN